MKQGIELRQVINQLREELTALTQTVQGEGLRFAVESIDVELHVGVTKGGGGDMKAKFWVLEAGAKGEYRAHADHQAHAQAEARGRVPGHRDAHLA